MDADTFTLVLIIELAAIAVAALLAVPALWGVSAELRRGRDAAGRRLKRSKRLSWKRQKAADAAVEAA